MQPDVRSTDRLIGAQQSPAEPVENHKIKLAIVCGNKYAFRSMYVPVVRQLSKMSSISIYLQDYPQDYDITALLEELCNEEIVETYTFIPNDSYRWRHHRALQAIYRSLSREKLDLLIVDEDSQPISRYLINLARSKHAAVVGLQKEIPARLLSAFESANSRNSESRFSQASANPRESRSAKLLRWFDMVIRRPRFILGVLLQRCNQWLSSRLNYWLLPLVLVGHKLKTPEHHRVTHGFPSTQVDTTIVYAHQFKKALLYFFPWLSVTVAQHPLAQNCRCKAEDSKTKLLVVLSGPWRDWIAQGNPADSIEQRWFEAILKAAELKRFSEVDIRPHPRETDGYPEQLAQRLQTHGIKAQVVDARSQALPEVICNYAGLIAPPSSLLAEAAVSCKRGFVICLQSVEVENYWPSIQSLADGVVSKRRGEELTAEDFDKLPITDAACSTVCGVMKSIIAERASLSGESMSSPVSWS